MRLYSIYILTFILLSGFASQTSAELGHRKHLVTVNHPAFAKDAPNQFYLWELRTDGGKLKGYYLETESVICVDHRCRIVPVRLVWDILGNYLKYELPDGVILEKKEGKPFLPEDYDRLHEILLDRSSPYGRLSYYDITHEKIQGEGAVDAVTGATAVTIDEAKTVAGGAWTCYTLWHWANGGIVQEIQRITGVATNLEELLSHIASVELQRQLFALAELNKRKNYDSQVVLTIVEQVGKKTSDPQFLKTTLTYLAQAPAAIYYPSLRKLLKASTKSRRVVLWNAILKYKVAPPVGYFDDLLDKLLQTGDYQEIDLFLTILEERNSSTSRLIENMIPLLEEEYSILNRRVYWFLSEQELTIVQKKVLKTYYDQYADYL